MQETCSTKECVKRFTPRIEQFMRPVLAKIPYNLTYIDYPDIKSHLRILWVLTVVVPLWSAVSLPTEVFASTHKVPIKFHAAARCHGYFLSN